jgi:hypothetical protein
MSTTLRWYFGASGSEHHGPNDSIMTTFKGNKYYSLAREVIQNSLDAIDRSKQRPVKVSFSLEELIPALIPGFPDIKHEIRLCAEFYNNDEKFKTFCVTAEKLLAADTITCLRISDYNTVGMAYNKEGDKSPFYAFMKAVGFNLKASQGAGGSFGYGKGAYYAASQLRSVFVSGIYGDNQYIFQGKARLTTHKDVAGSLKDYSGLYGLEDGSPVTSLDLIPDVFKRTEKGTDIIIIGFHQETNWKDSLIKSVLNNFWLSILEDKLVVKVENTVITKDNLEEIINQYYSENDSDGGIHEPETWNPYPYFKAVKYNPGANTKYFQEDLPTLGPVKLYILLKEGLPNRTVYLRSPKMIVFKKTDNKGFNYAAVFVCDNEKGNGILRQMENPQHNEWKKNNYAENDTPHPDARRAEDEIKAFVKKSLERLMTAEAGKSQKIAGLDNYLAIPEDLLAENEGNADAEKGSTVSTTTTPTETAVEITRKGIVAAVTLAVKKNTSVAATTDGHPDPEADNPGLGSLPPETLAGADGNEGNEEEPLPGDDFGKTDTPADESKEHKTRKPLPVRYRVIAQVNPDGEIRHLLKIHSTKEASAEIELYAGLDNESDSGDSMLSIGSATINSLPLTVRDNKITAIPLLNGWNLIDVRFDSNQKHALKLKSYEI